VIRSGTELFRSAIEPRAIGAIHRLLERSPEPLASMGLREVMCPRWLGAQHAWYVAGPPCHVMATARGRLVLEELTVRLRFELVPAAELLWLSDDCCFVHPIEFYVPLGSLLRQRPYQ
jgi:hypothetical protein